MVHHSNPVDRVVIHALADRLRNHVDSLVIHNLHALQQFFHRKPGKVIAPQTVHMLLQGTDRLHQRPLKVVADAHHFARGLHLRRQSTLRRDKLIERQSRYLHYTVVKGRLKAGVSLARDGVFDLVQRIAERNLCRHLGDRIPGGLTRQRGRTAHTGIHFDHTIFKAGGMQGKLHVTASRNLQLVDDI